MDAFAISCAEISAAERPTARIPDVGAAVRSGLFSESLSQFRSTVDARSVDSVREFIITDVSELQSESSPESLSKSLEDMLSDVFPDKSSSESPSSSSSLSLSLLDSPTSYSCVACFGAAFGAGFGAAFGAGFGAAFGAAFAATFGAAFGAAFGTDLDVGLGKDLEVCFAIDCFSLHVFIGRTRFCADALLAEEIQGTGGAGCVYAIANGIRMLCATACKTSASVLVLGWPP
jgi:hypothetical protein